MLFFLNSISASRTKKLFRRSYYLPPESPLKFIDEHQLVGVEARLACLPAIRGPGATSGRSCSVDVPHALALEGDPNFNETCTLAPVAGMLMLWPGYLRHCSRVHLARAPWVRVALRIELYGRPGAGTR